MMRNLKWGAFLASPFLAAAALAGWFRWLANGSPAVSLLDAGHWLVVFGAGVVLGLGWAACHAEDRLDEERRRSAEDRSILFGALDDRDELAARLARLHPHRPRAQNN